MQIKKDLMHHIGDQLDVVSHINKDIHLEDWEREVAVLGRLLISISDLSGLTFTYVADDLTMTPGSIKTVYICNSQEDFTIILPDISVCKGDRFHIKNINTGIVTVQASPGSLIDGLSKLPLAQWDGLIVITDGVNWYIT